MASFGVSSVSASEEDENRIKQLQAAAALKDPTMAAAALASAQAQAMQDAAKNENAGPVMAFAGMNMASGAVGGNAASLYQMGQQQAQPASAPAGWTCACGQVNQGKFCQNCGAAKPAGAPLYRCDKCGYQPENPNNPPKFCPQCGDKFDDGDKQ